ncbi:MAG: fumarylacetoacetate hydrolase family protein [Bacillota bacterium]|nr:fumarylacetoacetate hydrolase family protein [Bacillota bacterium]
MKLIRFKAENKICNGRLEGDTVIELTSGEGEGLFALNRETGRRLSPENVELLAPCAPSKVVCLGLNYRSHAEEVKLELPRKPMIFLKPSTAVIGPEEAIIYPPQSRRLDYEAELGVVVGRKAYHLNRSEALDYVIGYTCANDVTARDKQPARGQWTYAKGFDTFCPLGPVIETDIDNPELLKLQGLLNGRVVQDVSTADHIFPVSEIIEFITGCMTLLPGDVILTGTPAGIGAMEPGDRFEVVIDRIGRLANPVKKSG